MGSVVKDNFANDAYNQSEKLKLNLTDFRLILHDLIAFCFLLLLKNKIILLTFQPVCGRWSLLVCDVAHAKVTVKNDMIIPWEIFIIE